MARLGIFLSLFVHIAAATGSFAFSPLFDTRVVIDKASLVGTTTATTTTTTTLRAKEFLTEDGGVRKEILFDGSGEPPESGTKLHMSYSGSLAPADWSPNEVVDCWLSEQQGLDHLGGSFLEQGIDEARLTDADAFDEDFVRDSLKVEAKIQRKKLVLAAKRLAATRGELPPGHVFDTNPEYSYVLGSDKLIRGMEIGLAAMKAGEWAIIGIRSDYGYGSEGYRKADGEVVVPPFATLNFEVQLYPEGITDLKGLEEFWEEDDDDAVHVSFD